MDDTIEIKVQVAEMRAELRAEREQRARDRTHTHTEQVRLFEALDSLTANLEELRRELAKYKGLAGGAMFVVSGLWALFALFKDRFWH